MTSAVAAALDLRANVIRENRGDAIWVIVPLLTTLLDAARVLGHEVQRLDAARGEGRGPAARASMRTNDDIRMMSSFVHPSRAP